MCRRLRYWQDYDRVLRKLCKAHVQQNWRQKKTSTKRHKQKTGIVQYLGLACLFLPSFFFFLGSRILANPGWRKKKWHGHERRDRGWGKKEQETLFEEWLSFFYILAHAHTPWDVLCVIIWETETIEKKRLLKKRDKEKVKDTTALCLKISWACP